MSLNYIYAHTPSRDAPHRWHMLEDHILETAKAAYAFAKAFGSEDAGFVLGIFHDLGKANPAFQGYLKACAQGEKIESVPHAVCGASYLWKILLRQNSRDASVAMCALGHHGGLSAEHLAATKGGKLDQWWSDVRNIQLKKRIQEALQGLPVRAPETLPEDDLRRELRLWMLFSALVDADYLNTEKHFDQGRSAERGYWTRPADLWPVFRADQLRTMWRGRGSGINRIRKQIYFSCVRAGRQPPGVFRLTVPTGGGKTRSGLAFALSHAAVLSMINLQQVQDKGFKKMDSGAVIMDDDARKTLLVTYQERKQEEITHPFLNEKIMIGMLFHIQSMLMARYLRGDLDGYPPFIWK